MNNNGMNDKTLANAVTAIQQHGVICYPTEGVWGLGCHPQSVQAFDKLLTIKQRPADKGVILIAAEMAQVHPYADISPECLSQLMDLWPGFVTCILPKAMDCPAYLCGQHDNIAIRITAYEPVKALCLAANTALVSTSANLSGQPTVTNIEQAKTVFGDAVDVYLDASLGGESKSSRIIAWQQGNQVIIRE